MVIVWRYFSKKHQRYFDDPAEVETHLSNFPDDQIEEVAVDSTASGVVPELPDSTTYFIRTGNQVSEVAELTFSGGQLSVTESGSSPVTYVSDLVLNSASGSLQSDIDDKLDKPSPSGAESSIAVFDSNNGITSSIGMIADNGNFFLGSSGTFEPNYAITARFPSQSGNGIWLKASDLIGTVFLHAEDADGTLQLLHLTSEGEFGFGTEFPEYSIDVQQTAGSGAGSINAANQYFKAGRRIDSQVQADFTLGTDLLSINSELAINTGSEIQVGTDFTVNANNITIANAGTYRVSWNVCAIITGTTNNRRRNLQTELNRNSGTIVQATRAAGYARQGNNANTCSAGGTYLIQTTVADETVAIRTEDVSAQSTSSITFTVVGGYISVERVD